MRVAGIDSSTQSVKVAITDGGEIMRTGRAPHPAGTEVHPDAWWDALRNAVDAAGGIADVQAVSVAGQQHGLICLDADGCVLRPALLWNDTRSAASAQDLIMEKSPDYWVHACGSAPIASLTVSKLRWVADNEPEIASRIAAVCLPHDWLTWRLSGSRDIHDLVTDRSDASGTGYLDTRTGEYRYDLLALALRISEAQARRIVLPRVLDPFEPAGKLDPAFGMALLAPGCGDNAAAALALGLAPGDASISLGTSGVVAAVSKKPVYDPRAEVTGFMDASGAWLPLACTLNGSRIVDYACSVLGADYEEFDQLVQRSEPSTAVLIPYFVGERTPNLPQAKAMMFGMTPQTMTRETFARAAAEGMCCLMRGALEAMRRGGIHIERGRLIGGGAKSEIVRQMMADLLDIPLSVPAPAEYVALGAAWQAERMLNPKLHVWSFLEEHYAPSGDTHVWEKYQQAAEVASGVYGAFNQ